MTHPNDALRLVPEASTGEMQAAGRDALEPFVGILKQPVEDQWHLARLVWSAMLAAAPASPLPEGGGWPVHIVRANGATVDEQRRAVLKSETYKHGDMVLVWVSEGDLYGNPFVELEQLPAAPTGAK